MQWTKNDISQYLDVKEYVDTLVIPLVPLTLDTEKQVDKLASQAEVLKIFSSELERQYTGRILLMPSYNYLSKNDRQTEIERLNSWIKEAKTNPFEHVFFITFDPQWKKIESSLDGTLLWFPSIPTSDTRSKESQMMIKEQINQVSELIKSYW